MGATIGVITNPNSKKNRRRGDRCGELQRAVGRTGMVRQTRGVEEIADVVEEFLDAGCEYWVSDGGDGSLNWLLSIADGVMRAHEEQGDARPWPVVVPTNGGTIDFVAKKAGIRGQAEDILTRLGDRVTRGSSPRTVSLDTLRMVGVPRGGDEQEFSRVGFATAIGGAAQRFFALYYRDDVPGPSTIVKIVTGGVLGMVGNSLAPLRGLAPEAARELAEELFRPTEARVEVDGELIPAGRFQSLQVGAIDINLGGVVRTFRYAAEPGTLHFQAVASSSAMLAANLPNMVLGTRLWGPGNWELRGRHVKVSAVGDEALAPVIDGECFHGLEELEVTFGPRVRLPLI